MDKQVLDLIQAERQRQLWGDEHGRTVHYDEDWALLLQKYSGKLAHEALVGGEFERRLVQIAALAIAALEARHDD